MFRQQHVSVTGFQVADADSTIAESIRGSIIPAFATLAREDDMGHENWRIYRPGDPANMMYWALDPNQPPVRGTVTGSYSYVFPARKKPDGKFLPLDVPGSLAYSYKPEAIEEAGPLDWLVVGTVKHGDRRKLAFRNPAGPNLILIADHRSDKPPTLSSIVHDGKGDRHDDVRKAGLHTCWEVRQWVTPAPDPAQQPVPLPISGGKTQATPSTPKKGPEPTVTRKWSIAWIADSSADGTGFCRIGFGDKDGLYSHMTGGPFIPSVKQKHWLGDTVDGPMMAGALSTNSFFRGSDHPFSAPLEFEEKPYPTVTEGKFPYWVRLHYDDDVLHPFMGQLRRGMWRWYVKLPITETPKCTPTKDYSSVDTNSNPNRTYAEDSRLFVPEKMISNGIYFQPRVNLVQGRKPDRTAARKGTGV